MSERPSQRPKSNEKNLRRKRSKEADKPSKELLITDAADQILIEIFGANFEDAKIILGPILLDFYDEVKDETSRGWKFKGTVIEKGDLYIIWGNREKEGKISLREYFGDDNRERLLGLLDEKVLENIEKSETKVEFERFLKAEVFKVLKEFRPFLGRKKMRESFLVKEELFPIFAEQYRNGGSVTLVKQPNGFVLKDKFRKYPDYTFDLREYDKRLFPKRLESTEIEKIEALKGEFYSLADEANTLLELQSEEALGEYETDEDNKLFDEKDRELISRVLENMESLGKKYPYLKEKCERNRKFANEQINFMDKEGISTSQTSLQHILYGHYAEAGPEEEFRKDQQKADYDKAVEERDVIKIQAYNLLSRYEALIINLLSGEEYIDFDFGD